MCDNITNGSDACQINYASAVTLLNETQDEISVLICIKLFNELKITNISILV